MLKTKRIYYGPEGAETSLYWRVKVTAAKRPVVIDGKVEHALRATPGVTIGCGLSNVAIDNKDAFPHAVYLAAFTKSTALIVSGLKADGSPAKAVLYKHHYSHITEANDDGTLKKMVKENPALMERKFTLHVPRQSSGGAGGHSASRRRRGGIEHGMSFVPRGALQRAVRAGRIHKAAADQITNIVKQAS